MENEDIIQSPDDSLNQSIQEQVVDSNQSTEEIKPYIQEKKILEFDDVKNFIGSYLNPKEKPEILTEVVSKPLKYGIFLDTATEFFNQEEKRKAEKQLTENPDIVKVNSTTYIDTNTGKNIYA